MTKFRLLISMVCAVMTIIVVTAQDSTGGNVTINDNIQFAIVYTEPDDSSDPVEAVLGGSVVTRLSDSEDDDGLRWWQVETLSGNQGWIPETVDGLAVFEGSDTGTPANGGTTASVAPLTSDPVEIRGEATLSGEAALILLYEEQDTESDVLEALISGLTVNVLDGPVEVDGENWWQVETVAGNTGWIQDIVNNLRVFGDVQASIITIGTEVIVSVDDFLLFYDEPGISENVLEAITSGVRVPIIGGPETIDGIDWWQIESPAGNEGWIPEVVDNTVVLFTEAALPTPTPLPTATVPPTATPRPTMTPTPVPITCPGTLQSRLVVGETARVIPGPSNNMRREPNLNSARLDQIPGGAAFDVLDGPECANGYAWWQVSYGGRVGWTAEAASDEYWLEPINP